MKTRIAVVVLSIATVADLGLHAQGRTGPAKPSQSDFATLSSLPSLSRSPSEALAVDEAGTVIVGYSWDGNDLLHPVMWIRQNGTWVITALPYAPTATSAIARSVNNWGEVAGNDFPASISHPILWYATGQFTALGCGDEVAPATVYGISALAQVVVGSEGGSGSVWQPGRCRDALPSLFPGGTSGAFAVNGDGTIVGGGAAASVSASSVPVRWTNLQTPWQIEQLDNRAGVVLGANAAGDLGGYVMIPCALQDGCQRGVIWYAAGGSRELGTLGGAHSWIRDINSSREVVGVSTSPHVGNTGFFWSESVGMVQLPFNGHWAAANAVSDVRTDGTRLVVGMSSQGTAVVWVVRAP